MIPVSRLSDLHSCPIPLHGPTPLASGAPAVFVNGLPVARVGDKAGCGAVIVSGFPHILVDGRPMAHFGSLTSHGGSIVTGSRDCVGGEVNFMTSKLVVDFGRLGAVREDGSVDETLMAELLGDPQLEQRAQAAGALVQTSKGAATTGVFTHHFLVIDSDAGSPIIDRPFVASVDGKDIKGRTDSAGRLALVAPTPNSRVSVHIEFKSPTRPLTELSKNLKHIEERFITTLISSKPSAAPTVISVNDRAATRESIIFQVRASGRQFLERSEWRARQLDLKLKPDWNYQMIALHHAGRSYGCGRGALQMLDIQRSHQKKDFDDIGYHFGVDCDGKIYEGRDIRLKGTHLEHYNSHAIGIVLLNNLTHAEEGDDLTSFTRNTLESMGVNTTSTLLTPQIDSVTYLIQTLQTLFNITQAGGHREFPKQQSKDAKTCPGEIGMELVAHIRAKTNLSAPIHP